jgi:hypothetical protein
MWLFIAITITLFLGLVFMSALMRREEIMANWSQYKSDPFYMFAAPLFKPDEDPRSRLEFGADNFKDNVLAMLTRIFAVLLQPVFQVFKLFTEAISQSMNGIFNVNALLANMWKKWNSMTDIFTRRFNAVFHQFRVTFTKIYNSMEKSYGVAVSSMFAGLSTIHTMTSFLDLVMKIVIAILVILVVMVILLFFVLAPFIPMILTVIGIIAATAMGGAVGGMAESFCFTPDTKVQTKDGPIPISSLKLGQYIDQHTQIQAILKFNHAMYDLYELDGIRVAGSHIVFHEGNPILVKAHPEARKIPQPSELYCLITSTHTIPIVGNSRIHVFADWEEIEGIENLSVWYQSTYKFLNNHNPTSIPSERTLTTEAAFAKGTQVCTPNGTSAIESLCPGDIVYSENGPTIITGIVNLHPSLIKEVTLLESTCISTGVWLKDNLWTHPEGESQDAPRTEWYNLFTKDGTFQIKTTTRYIICRDFSDIGTSQLESTYEATLKKLQV